MMTLRKLYTLKRLILATVLFVWLQPGAALPLTGLYSQQIAVSNEGDSERERAVTAALAAVIVKVTGEQRWLENPVIESAIANALSYVEGISFESKPVELPIEDNSVGNDPANAAFYTVEQRYINVDFAASLIDELLAKADIPVWDSNRPSVLLWMVLQNAAGERSFLTGDGRPDIVQVIQDFAEQRGLPIIFPVLDFEDRRNLSVDTAWIQDEEAINNASQRYDADSILSGRLHFTDSGELIGVWKFIFQDETEVFDDVDEDLQAYLYKPLDRITNRLAGYFAIVPETSNQQIVRLRVDGIKNLSAYSALLSYVQSLGLVENVTAAELDGERIELQLGLFGDSRQLFEQIALDRDLRPIQDSSANPPSLLHYRWTR
ncbi:MAG: DUF2066 domain-containing protein [Pseudohongiella sp.]|nr:DUF2066 domain-containing protein [Pseudohongiella sp.]